MAEKDATRNSIKSQKRKQIAGSHQLHPLSLGKVIGYLEDGKALIDNNAVENKIRPLALGRKNYLFAGPHKGAERGGMVYSFFACCKLNGVNPSEWLKYVFENIPTINTDNEEQLLKLLPNNFQQLQNTELTE